MSNKDQGDDRKGGGGRGLKGWGERHFTNRLKWKEQMLTICYLRHSNLFLLLLHAQILKIEVNKQPVLLPSLSDVLWPPWRSIHGLFWQLDCTETKLSREVCFVTQGFALNLEVPTGCQRFLTCHKRKLLVWIQKRFVH